MTGTYTTVSGDTWDAIAARVSLAPGVPGAERYMDLWLEANPYYGYVARFDAGVVLNIPAAPDPARPSSLPPWRRP